LKDRVPAVTGAKGKALEVIRSAAAKKTNLYVLDETFTYRKKGEQIMSYSGIRLQLEDIAIALKGDHQLLNAALALCVLELLGSAGLTLRESAVREGLSSAEWPGRLELIAGGCGKPDILLDGAHNPNGAKALAGYLRTHVEKRRIIMIFGVMKDKDFVEMLGEVLPLVDRTILTRTQTDRAASSNDLVPYAPGAVVTETVEEALECAFGAADSGSLVLITGSLYTVGEAKRVLEKSA
jgi:dihydrofolate synthase/folylpolyglutamate synthase